MAIDALLRKEVGDFLSSRISEFESKIGRKALLLDSGLEELVSHIDFEGNTHTFVTLLIGYLHRYGTLSNGRNALEHFLSELEDGDYVGLDGKEKLHAFQERLRNESKEGVPGSSSRPSMSGKSRERIKRKIRENEELLDILQQKVQFLKKDLVTQVDPNQRFSTETNIKKIEEQIEELEAENERLENSL